MEPQNTQNTQNTQMGTGEDTVDLQSKRIALARQGTAALCVFCVFCGSILLTGPHQ